MGAFSPVTPPSPVAAPSPQPMSSRLAGKGVLSEPTLDQQAQSVQREIDSLKTLVQGFGTQYPQAEKAAETAIQAIQKMADAVLATLEPPLGAEISPPPGLVG